MIVTYPMVNYNIESDKETGSRTDAVNNKPAVITIDVPGDDARTVEAQHCMRSDDGTLSIYLGSRSEGIDIQVHISRCVIDRVRWHAGREGVCSRCGKTAALTEDKECQTCYNLACPGCGTGHVGGYEGSPSCTENCGFFSDVVDVRGKFDDGETISLFELKSVVGEWISSETGQDPDTVQENPVPEMDGIILQSGKHSVHMPFTGDLDSLEDEVPYSAPVQTNSPNATLEAATRVGDIVQDVQGHDRDESDPDIIADGGREIVNGDSVLHAGQQYRVARVGESQVEIYRLGDGSEIVPINSVEPVPEVQG